MARLVPEARSGCLNTLENLDTGSSTVSEFNLMQPKVAPFQKLHRGKQAGRLFSLAAEDGFEPPPPACDEGTESGSISGREKRFQSRVRKARKRVPFIKSLAHSKELMSAPGPHTKDSTRSWSVGIWPQVLSHGGTRSDRIDSRCDRWGWGFGWQEFLARLGIREVSEEVVDSWKLEKHETSFL